MSKSRTHYDNLKIHPDAPDAVIRAAYKALSQQHHPDKQSPADKEKAGKIMQIINEARDILLDPIKRKAYDEKILKEQSFEDEARKQREAEAKSRDEELRRQQTNENHGHQKQSVTYGDYFKAMTTLLNDASKVVLDPIKHKAYAEKILREQAAADEAARKQREADAREEARKQREAYAREEARKQREAYAREEARKQREAYAREEEAAIKRRASKDSDESGSADTIVICIFIFIFIIFFIALSSKNSSNPVPVQPVQQEKTTVVQQKITTQINSNNEPIDAEAQYSLGLAYATGKGEAQDSVKAVYWFRKAANQGHADAQYLLGLEYATGKGVAQDFPKAVFWFRKAANQGVAEAKRELDKLTAAEVEEAEKKQAAARSSIMQMIDYAVDNGGVGHESEIQEVKRKIEASPKPAKGNKTVARKINEEALALLNTQDFGGAVAKFVEANRLDASDIEIVNNLGFAYLKQKNLESAQQTLITALTMSPDRAAAWSNLAEVFALGGDERKAVACYANTYRFSKAIIRTHQFMKKLNADEYIPASKQAREAAMVLAEKMHPELIVTVPNIQKEVTTPQAVELPQEKTVQEKSEAENLNACKTKVRSNSSAPLTLRYGYISTEVTEGGHLYNFTATDSEGWHQITCYLDKQANVIDFKATPNFKQIIPTPISTNSEPTDANAQYNLGKAYDYGTGVPKDHTKAVYWYRRAAEQGHANAQFYLGTAYEYGIGVQQDDVQAADWYRKAAAQNKL